MKRKWKWLLTAGSNIRQPTEECQQVGSYKRQLHKVSHHHHHRLDDCLPWAQHSARQLGPNFVMWLLSASPTSLRVMISENLYICGVYRVLQNNWQTLVAYNWDIIWSFLSVFVLFWLSNMGDFSLWYSLGIWMKKKFKNLTLKKG